jgi:hypothetical protein
MISYDDTGGMVVEFDTGSSANNRTITKIALPIELYLRCVQESTSLESLRVKVFEAQADLNSIERRQRQRAAAGGRA